MARESQVLLRVHRGLAVNPERSRKKQTADEKGGGTGHCRTACKRIRLHRQCRGSIHSGRDPPLL